uniref:CHCH domain-containing protein n=1 Tax=Heterorhabditis bacteriophora TaxID=37862 RepID=A0A1I7WUK8_HETBA
MKMPLLGVRSDSLQEEIISSYQLKECSRQFKIIMYFECRAVTEEFCAPYHKLYSTCVINLHILKYEMVILY